MRESCEIDNLPSGWAERLKSWSFWKPFFGFAVGAIAGAFYFYNLGYQSGASPVTNDIISNALFGGMIGYLFIRRPCRSCC